MQPAKTIPGLLLTSLLAIACSPAPAPEPQAAAQPAEADSPEALDALGSLDDLLPEEFSALTQAWMGDLDGMSQRHVMRVLVVGGGPQFFYFDGKPRGIVAELLVELQEEINADLDRRYSQLEVVPMPVSRDRLVPALVSGRADLIAADITITEGRSELVDFSIPLVTNIDEVVVFAPGVGDAVQTLEQMSGRGVYVRRSSSYHEHILALNKNLAAAGLDPVRIVEVNELLRSQDILEMVNAGMIAATVIDSYKASFWSEIFPDMHVREDLVVHEGGEIAWAFRKGSPLMKAAMDKFARGHRQGTLIGNVLIERYMENLDWVRDSTADDAYQRLDLMLDLFRQSGDENNLDPLMLVAQAYQESELDHSKVSPAGARGIMQIKPSTAADRNVGVADISSPANNIRAGARYMRFLMDRYFSDSDIDDVQAWFFALAAYNAGPARVQAMRRRAVDEGHNPDIWVDNVELIAARVIGRETVRYVRNVFKYYVAYRLAFEEQELRETMRAN